MPLTNIDKARSLLEGQGYRILARQTPDELLDQDWCSFLFALRAASDRAKNGARIHLTSHGYDPVSTLRSAIHRMIDEVLETAVVEPATAAE